MLETILPFGAILAGSGLGELIKKYISVNRRPTERSDELRSRPRVQVTGPKVQPEICQICMGKIKEGTEYVRCSSGKVFHAICLARVGNCPYCQRTIATKGMESSTKREYALPMAPQPIDLPPEEEAVEAEAADIKCPACGGTLEPDATSCECGVIFVTEGGSFACPTCRSEVKEGAAFCDVCGEGFQQLEPPQCPVCGRQIVAGTEICQCGTILGNACPECGTELSEDQSTCPTCGARYEFL